MALGEVQVSGELLAIIGAAVALGVGMFGSTRWIHKDVERIRTDVSNLEGRLSEDMNRLEGRLSEDMNRLEGRLSEDMNKLEGRLSGEVNRLDGRLDEIRDEMTAGFRLIADRLTNVGDRLSKVEGVIEGMFWSARNPPDTAKEGAA